MTIVRSTCPYCGVGCGIVARPDGAGGAHILGDKTHPANQGRLCSKGSALGETVFLDNRLLDPVIAGRKAGWDEALALVADRFRAVIDEHGPDAVAFYVSGQLLSEDYYVANKLMKGFIGSANIDTNSRLCMASSVAGHRRAFGTDTVPGLYDDFDHADVVVLVGSNMAWCHPVLYQRLAAAKNARPDLKVVTIDPRRTATSDISDLHLAIRSAGDIALFNGLLVRLAESDCLDKHYIETFTEGFESTLESARGDTLDATGLSQNDIEAFYALWLGTKKVVTVYSQGVNQSSSGTDKVNAIINCHLASGRIGQPGMGPFSVTGQPNAMGGREVGGLANMLACHLDLEDAAHRAAVRAFWEAPRIAEQAGLKAVDMFKAVGDGRIKAIWIIHTNPVVSMPDADAVAAALKACPFVVVSDITGSTDTARLAHVLLPATAWGEKSGTVTNSERCISRQRAFLPIPGNARPDWSILADVGRRMGYGKAFDYASEAEIFREYAALSRIAGHLGRDFDISARADITDADYDAMEPFIWPHNEKRSGGRFFADGAFYTPNGKGRLIAVRTRAPAASLSDAYPLRMNTGRVRDHWHTMTRTALSPRLSAHLAEPFVEIHSGTARDLGLEPAGLATVESPIGSAIVRVLVSDRIGENDVFIPMHWTGETASRGRICALIPAVTDPTSGQPESKAGICRITPYKATAYGFALSVNEPHCDAPYWAKARARGGWRMELALDDVPDDWAAWASNLFGIKQRITPMMVEDRKRGSCRLAFMDGHRLLGALFIAREPVAVSRQYVLGALAGIEDTDILAGKPGGERPDPGATVCACFDVGVNTIRLAIEEQGLASVEAIGAALAAGTNCGSCKPELRALLEEAAGRLAAE